MEFVVDIRKPKVGGWHQGHRSSGWVSLEHARNILHDYFRQFTQRNYSLDDIEDEFMEPRTDLQVLIGYRFKQGWPDQIPLIGINYTAGEVVFVYIASECPGPDRQFAKQLVDAIEKSNRKWSTIEHILWKYAHIQESYVHEIARLL